MSRLWPPGVSKRSSHLLQCVVRSPPLGGAPSPGPHRGSDGRMAEAGGPESAAARCPDESSDSEPEQEPGTPQKLIRKVSTSGQIRSKVRRVQIPACISGHDLWSVSVFIQRGWATHSPEVHRCPRGRQRYTELHTKISQFNITTFNGQIISNVQYKLRPSPNNQGPLCNTACIRHPKHLLWLSDVMFYVRFDPHPRGSLLHLLLTADSVQLLKRWTFSWNQRCLLDLDLADLKS